jgi:hypothetical protein
MEMGKKYKLISLSLLCLLADTNGLYAIRTLDELGVVREAINELRDNASFGSNPKVREIEKVLDGKTSNQQAQVVCWLATQNRELREEIAALNQRLNDAQQVASLAVGEVPPAPPPPPPPPPPSPHESTPSPHESVLDRIKRGGGVSVMGDLENARKNLRKLPENAENKGGKISHGEKGDSLQDRMVAALEQEIAERKKRAPVDIDEMVRRNKEEAKRASANANPFPVLRRNQSAGNAVNGAPNGANDPRQSANANASPFPALRKVPPAGNAANGAPNGANVAPRARVSGSIPGAVSATRYFLAPDALTLDSEIQAAFAEFKKGKLTLNKFVLLVVQRIDAIYKAKRVDRKEDEIRDAVKALVDYAVANGVKEITPDMLRRRILGALGYFDRR